MKDVLDHIKKTIGLEEEDEVKEEQDTIIVPEHSFYEIIMMKAKNLDDFDYALNQIIEEKTPIIMDMGYLERDSPEDFKLAGEKLKAFRTKTGGEAILLCKNGKNTIIITPPEIKLIRK
ncbi:MAG: cell division protein SepF [Methanobacterium paludis]|uniref:Cell division protein SepF n=1 Tax=Methanobacterium paludis (strain DSM 25820 / JCM 18151 / SWAN1) TaxID=868131 RepID=F6D3C3_METPW|nr:cell division protein SepF [Methanobacterium paludis]AEG18715.1 hypothetical protein MSWAN_1704 [Methanobacterium paludis]MCE7697815.1 cell division protein SepF [Methanobacterium paludis]